MDQILQVENTLDRQFKSWQTRYPSIENPVPAKILTFRIGDNPEPGILFGRHCGVWPAIPVGTCLYWPNYTEYRQYLPTRIFSERLQFSQVLSAFN